MNSRFSVIVAICFSILCPRGVSDELLKLDEVLSVVRSNLTDVSEAELDHAAAMGLLQQLGGRLQLAGEPAAESSNLVAKAAVYAQNFGYLRVATVTSNLAEALEKSWQELAASNRLTGTILDLRYATGSNYDGAAETADLFVKSEQPLFKTGPKEFRSSKAARKLAGPVAVLINGQTSSAAEALAGALRESGAALLIGNRTAGEARLFETVELSTGQKLRVGKVPVEIAGKIVGTNGVVPDISVPVNTLDERAYFQDPYVVIPRGLTEGRGTNEVAGLSGRARRISEADLVRRHRDGLDFSATTEDTPETNAQIIMDPVLARAVDFLKGLAALRRGSTN